MDAFGPTQGDRFLLWIDAVGGFWVCLGQSVTLGQPVPGAAADVAILGDLSSRHARIRRDGEGYVIEPLHEVRVDGRLVRGTASLADGNLVQLGPSVRLRFRRPHALSATARLDFVSRHRTQPSADAIVLMADSFVLGPKPHSHVVCRQWREELILYRCEERLYCRTSGPFQIDGKDHRDKGPITRSSRIAGDRFAMSLEPL